MPVLSLYLFLFHFLFVSMLQLENAFFVQKTFSLGAFSFPENFLISIILSLIYLGVRKINGVSHFFKFILGLFFVLLISNQVFYQIFHVDFSFSFVEGFKIAETGNYFGSFLEELRFFNYLNFLLGAFGLFFLYEEKKIEQFFFFPSKLLFLLTVIITLGFSGWNYFGGHVNVRKYPLQNAFFEVFKGQKKAFAGVTNSSFDEVYRLKYGKSKSHKALKRPATQKNIIFVIVESVGSVNIIDQKTGLLKKERFPYLASIKKGKTIFSSLHNVFPATTRSHVPISTGGVHFTWGSVYKELIEDYQGPSINKELKRKGYRTALVSSMGLNFENLGQFYRNLKFDYTFDPDKSSGDDLSKDKANSWGINEFVSMRRMWNWLEQKSDKPFYIQYLTNSTHHPYTVPSSYFDSSKLKTNEEKYNKALEFTDSVIKNIVEGLRDRGMLKDTIIYICGDHGQAFGNRHEDNFLHKNFLYEENIKNFLITLDFSSKHETQTSNRSGSIGNILPTIVGKEYGDLFSSDFSDRVHYFHKNAAPELWGLLDGKWKYIATKIGNDVEELYDLESDPEEAHNILKDYPDRAAEYREKIANWYILANENYLKKIKGYKSFSGKKLSVDDLNTFGPKQVAVGYKLKDLSFHPLKKINPEERMTIWTRGDSYPVKTRLIYLFKSPSGKVIKKKFWHRKSWSTTYFTPSIKEPREEGIWTLKLFTKRKKVIEMKFEVSKDAPLMWSDLDETPAIRHVTFGVNLNSNEFLEQDHLHPQENMSAVLHISPFKSDKKLLFSWVDPKGKISKEFNFTIKRGWDKAWVYHRQKSPMLRGKWLLNIYDGKKLIKSDSFYSDPKSLLTNSIF